MSTRKPLTLAVLLLASLAWLGHVPAARGYSTFTSDTALEPSGFSDLAAHPNDFWSWDLTTIRYKFDSTFTADARIRDQVRLAFQEWDNADAAAYGATYSYNRASGFKPFGDIRSIAVHEIGHVLGLHHPDQGDAINRNFDLTPAPKPDNNNEVLRSWINPGDYNHVLSHDELDGFQYLYGHDLNFVEVTGATPAEILIKSGASGGATTWAVGGPSGFFRNAGDHYQGVQATSGTVTFNTASSTAMGFQTLGINWDYQNPSGNPTLGFKVQTHGTNNPTPVFHYDGSAGQHFNTYANTAVGANSKDDRLHTWSNPFPGPFPAANIIHVGVEQDVWDWNVVSAKVVTAGGDVAAPLLSFHDWTQTVVGVSASSASTEGPGDPGITTMGTIRIKARGLQLVAPLDTSLEVTRVGWAVADDLGLTLADLNRDTLNRLIDAKQFETVRDFHTTLYPGQTYQLIFEGDPSGVEDSLFLNRPDLVGRTLFLFAESRLGDATVGTYALVGTGPVVPEPSALVLAVVALAGLAAACVVKRKRRA